MGKAVPKSSNMDGDLNLDFLFKPKTVAILGASDDSRRLGGGVVLRFLIDHGFKGTIFPVNPKYEEVSGLKCYPTIAAIPETVDVVVVAVPSKAIIEALSEVSPGHVRAALILSSGFGEIGAVGRALENQLLEIAELRSIQIVGPNSVGIVNLLTGFVATISQYFDCEHLYPGGIALVSQSGAFGTAILAQADRVGLRFSNFVSSGNEVGLEFSDFAHYLICQPEVTAICGYIEGIRDGRKFLKFAVKAAQLKKPVIVLKVGSTDVGAEAAQSHTGSLAGSDAVAQAVFDTYGVLRADDGEDALDLLKVFDRSPSAKGLRLAILSHSGGAGVMAADMAASMGMELPELPKGLCDKLATLLPSFANIRNPLDMTGAASLNGQLMADCLRAVLADDEFDGAVLAVNLIWRDDAKLMSELADIAEIANKPFAVSWVAPKPENGQVLANAPYPVFGDPARTTRALARRMLYDENCRRRLDLSTPVSPFASDLVARSNFKSVAGQAKALSDLGIPLAHEILVTDVDDAVRFIEKMSGKVAMKIASPDIPHRTEIGGVVIGIDSEDGVRTAYARIMEAVKAHAPNAAIDGILVQEMAEGLEVLVGVKRDPVFGPMIVLGPGGILVDIIKQVEMGVAPLSIDEISDMLDVSVLGTLLAGYRGTPERDRAALIDLIMRVSWLAEFSDELIELDLNPIVVREDGKGCVAVDYKFTLRE